MPGRVLTVDVTQEDIDKAFRNNSARCVVAQAIARTFPKAHHIGVDMHTIRFTDGGKRYTYLTPPKVEGYVVAFDAGDTIHPFRFGLRTDQRMVLTRNKRTDAGKRQANAKQSEQYARRRAERVEADPEASEADKQVAREKVAAAEANRRVVEAEVATLPKSRNERHDDEPPVNEAGRPTVKPRTGRQTVHGRNTRAYGRRTMRENQPDDAPGDYRGPLDV